MSSDALNATAASLLGFLHEGPHTGWDLVQTVEASVGYFWNVTRSQVYRELKTLAAQGYVSEKRAGARDKVPYAITAAGKSAFAEWIGKKPGPDLLRMPVVVTVFFGKSVPPALLTRYLEKARMEHRERLESYRALEAGGAAGDEFQLATLQLGIAYEETVLRWFETLPWLRSGGSAHAKKPPRKRS